MYIAVLFPKIAVLIKPPVSGPPIIRDGKLVGTVTHVFANNPPRGYRIFIENIPDSAGKDGR